MNNKVLEFYFTFNEGGETVTVLDVIEFDTQNFKPSYVGETSYIEGAINKYLIASGVDPELPYLEYLKEEEKVIRLLLQFAKPEDKDGGCTASVHITHK